MLPFFSPSSLRGILGTRLFVSVIVFVLHFAELYALAYDGAFQESSQTFLPGQSCWKCNTI